MAEIAYDVEHRTHFPRTSDEKTVEAIEWRNESGSLRGYKFERIGECEDVWRFVEAKANGDILKDATDALTPTAVYTILKETPCVEIRNGTEKTVAQIEFTGAIRE